MSPPSAMGRPSSQDSTLTDTSLPDSLFSNLSGSSVAGSYITELLRTSTDALPLASCLKGESVDALPDILFGPAWDPIRELKHPPAPPSHLCDASEQPTSKLPRILFLDPQYPARRLPLGRVLSAITRAPTGTGCFPSPVEVAGQFSQM